MKKLNKKAFTLIELIVAIAVLGILVLLASPRFFGHIQNSELTKGFANARSIEKASELYYMDYEDWPRLTDEPYTSEEIESYSERIFDRTGHEVNLDTEGKYYDIDYDKLSDYVQVPDDKKNYILQNPVGKVFYMDNLNEAGIARVDYSSNKEEDDNPGGLRKPIEGEIVIDSADKLAKIGTSSEYPLDGKYILTANIDLSNIDNWIPIGNNDSRFKGSFDGNGYKIINLTIDRPSQNHVGLFGYTDKAIIENVALEDINVTGNRYVGGLMGYAENSIIESSYSTGSVTGSLYIGGLVGLANSSTTISSSYATGSVIGSGDYVGGLVSYANISTTISKSYATGSVRGSRYVGGLAGVSHFSSTIEKSYATGPVTGIDYVGGLVGFANSDTNINNSYATGSVTGGSSVGGLVGYATNNTTISSSHTTGSVEASGNSVGGLVGYAVSINISNSYATGSVTGRGYSAGGLVGWADSSTISNSYTTGQVKGTEDQIGGLAGYTQTSNISNSYATGTVTGSGSYVGGLVGQTSNSTIEKSYATGSVISAGRYVGGLVGYAYNGTRTSNSYWDTKTTGRTTSAGGVGKSTDEMKKQITYSGWDFKNVWEINDGNDYPKLR